MEQTKIQKIQDPSLNSYVIKVTPKDSLPFHIPVVDVRDGDEQREIAKRMTRAGNRSQYIPQSIYQISPKELLA